MNEYNTMQYNYCIVLYSFIHSSTRQPLIARSANIYDGDQSVVLYTITYTNINSVPNHYKLTKYHTTFWL